MTEHSREVGASLQMAGLRLTPQRLMIIETLQDSADHVSAEQLFERVRERYPYVNLSTIYRTLDVLRELNLVREARLGDGSIRYHWAEKGRHHHLICQRCGTETELDEMLTEELSSVIARRYAFKANLSHLTIFGTCQKCLS